MHRRHSLCSAAQPAGLTAAAYDAHINRREAYRFEDVASLPDERFEQVVAETKDAGHELTAAGIVREAGDGVLLVRPFCYGSGSTLKDQCSMPAVGGSSAVT